MPSPRVASRYAKSLADLAQERNQLETVYKDMQLLQDICKSSREFVNMLRSPIIKADKKQNIVDAVTKGRISGVSAAFTTLLIRKGRENILPEIVASFVELYNEIKGIHKVKLTTAVPVSEELKQSIINKVKAETSLQNIELTTEVREELIGGFVLEFNNNLLDASILRDLRDIQKQFKQNVYIYNIR
jgi:F-type H+-transporting ATPase subunit delta